MADKVVQGEAPESDDELQTQEPVKMVRNVESPVVKQGVVVMGEASESDDDEDDENDASAAASSSSSSKSGLIQLQVDASRRGDPDYIGSDPHVENDYDASAVSTATEEQEPKYDTLLHWKLKERNAEFRKNLCDTVGQVYLASAREMKSISQHLAKAHLAAQDVSHNMRLITNDLFHLEDKLDIITNCDLLPVITTPSDTAPSSPGSSSSSSATPPVAAASS